MSSSSEDILEDLQKQFDEQAAAGDFDGQLDEFMENTVVPVWKSNSPELTGKYVDSVGVTSKAHGGKGQVGATDDIANLVEYGSVHNEEHAPRAKTVAYFDRPNPL